MTVRIVRLKAYDVRFPTSLDRSGSDAMHPDPDYSAAYVVLETDSAGGLAGHGLAFTIGRGNDLVVAAIHRLSPFLEGERFETITEDLGGFWRRLVGDPQLRWLGPEKGVVHLATAAVVNAVWDLYARAQGKPLWKLLVDMTPEQIVSAIDFRYLTDALTPDETLRILRRLAPTKAEREAQVKREGYPAYTTSVGWLGYPDDRVRALCRRAIEEGWVAFKLKVGRDLQDDLRRASLVREEIGPDRVLMLDANQVWDVGQAVAWVRELAAFDPLWIEEPTSPDDVLGHAAIARAIHPVGVATGEHVHNRVMFKQFFQAQALSFCQPDCARLGGVNEFLAVLLLAAKFGVPVCPHTGGVGLCEYGQHLSIFDFVAVSGTMEGRYLEYVDHLHEHFLDPVVVRGGCYQVPHAPGFSVAMKPEALQTYAYPNGTYWSTVLSARG